MNYPSQALVHHLFASHLQIDDASIKNAHSFDELGLDPLDLILVVLRLEDFDRGNGDFPVAALAHARTIGDVVALVDFWRQRDTTACGGEKLVLDGSRARAIHEPTATTGAIRR